MDLNEEQMLAVKNPRHTVVNAGPGTGKTATLVARAVYWLEQGVPPEKMVLLTFSRKAAEEMSERIKKELKWRETDGVKKHGKEEIQNLTPTGNGSENVIQIPDSNRRSSSCFRDDRLFVGTIHGWCLWFLRRYSRNEKLPSLLADVDQEVLIKEVMKNLGVKGKESDWLLRVSKYKVWQPFYEEGELNAKLRGGNGELLLQVVNGYNSLLGKRGVMDFDDLLLRAWNELELLKNTDEHLSFGYQQVLVDEFQDLNVLQYNIVRHLFCKNCKNKDNSKEISLFVVGDPWQGIYGFRGADVGLFEQVADDFGPDVSTISLVRSYRCAQGILDLSAKLFSTNIKLQSYARKPMQAIWLHSLSDKTEAYWIINQIKQLTSNDESLTISQPITNIPIGLSDVVVCYRSYNVIGHLVKMFHSSSLPHQLIGEKKFTEFQDVGLILNFLEKILVKDIFFESKLASRLATDLLAADSWDMEQTLKMICKKLVKVEDFPHNSRMRRLQQISWQYRGEIFMTTLPFFLADIYSLSEADEYNDAADKIAVMSLHAAKGLEFEAVFVVGLEDGSLPHSRALDSRDEEEIEEERRLLYVGMTRSKRLLYLSTVDERYLYGERVKMRPSRFMKDLESSPLLQVEKDQLAERYFRQLRKKKEKERQGRLF